jgi:hypothetical protein
MIRALGGGFYFSWEVTGSAFVLGILLARDYGLLGALIVAFALSVSLGAIDWLIWKAGQFCTREDNIEKQTADKRDEETIVSPCTKLQGAVASGTTIKEPKSAGWVKCGVCSERVSFEDYDSHAEAHKESKRSSAP